MQENLMQSFEQNLAAVQNRIEAAAARVSRSPQEITLVAVSKTQSPEIIRAAYEAGQTLFGENRVQELLGKAPILPSAIRWHLIGHLQSNKVRKILPVCEMIHGVDSESLARDVDRIAGELGLFPRLLLEVNVAGESSKFGFSPEELLKALDGLLSLERVSVEGLMTVAPFVSDPEETRPVFAKLRALRDRCQDQSGVPLPVLSMGMTNDFEVAIEEGATHVRIGSALFGARPVKTDPGLQ